MLQNLYVSITGIWNIPLCEAQHVAEPICVHSGPLTDPGLGNLCASIAGRWKIPFYEARDVAEPVCYHSGTLNYPGSGNQPRGIPGHGMLQNVYVFIAGL